MGTKTLMTVEEFAQMNTLDIENYELVAGQLIPLPSGTPRHNKIRGRLLVRLLMYFHQNAIGEAFGELDCRTINKTVRRPDVSIYLNERLHQLDLDKIPAPLAPDIAVEVVSPSESAIDVLRKIREYLLAGCQEVWLLDHANAEVMVHTSGGIRVLQGDDFLDSPLLPDFSVSIGDLINV